MIELVRAIGKDIREFLWICAMGYLAPLLFGSVISLESDPCGALLAWPDPERPCRTPGVTYPHRTRQPFDSLDETRPAFQQQHQAGIAFVREKAVQ